jgi:hypothetical protein
MDNQALDNKVSNEVCPRCGKAFFCSKSGKCWCFEVYLTPEKQAFVNENFEGCLCPDCLRLIAEE